jgi:hypothetical protein
VTAAGIGQETLAAHIGVVASSATGQQVLGQGKIRVVWTAD